MALIIVSVGFAFESDGFFQPLNNWIHDYFLLFPFLLDSKSLYKAKKTKTQYPFGKELHPDSYPADPQ